MAIYEYNDWQFTEFEYEGGHLIVEVSVFTDETTVSGARLVFDTGAYVTVISRPTAKKAGLNLGSGIPATLQGFSRKSDPIIGEIIEIPCLMLGKHFIYNVKAVVPTDNVAIAEVLGENVLGYFDYTVDHRKKAIYFKKNPYPEPYINIEKGIDLACGKVLLAEETS